MLNSDLRGLSPAQAQAALSLASGASYTQAALSANVARSTVHEWQNSTPSFAAAVEAAREEYIDTLRDQLREASIKALAALISILDNPATSPGVRLKAALAILKRPHFPDPGWQLPESIEPPYRQAMLADLADLKAETQIHARQQNLAANRTKSDTFSQQPQPETPPQPQTPAASTTEPPRKPATAESRTQATAAPPRNHPGNQPVSSSKTGRNETCPCGSGLKFKRCCLNKRPQAADAAAA
ncbi:MAG: SEC-C domain-containing protein [Acidobacteria bacterium]|nr:SEC-C domain-containing protein [Acidobacteriota bacterium]